MAQQNQALAQAMSRYSPAVQTQARRSQYLTDALAQLQQSGGEIRGGWGELAAKLAGLYMLDRAQGKAQDKLAGTLKGEKDARLARILAGLPGGDAQMAGGVPAAPPLPPAQPPMPPPVAQAPQQPQAPPQPPQQVPPPMAQAPLAAQAPAESPDERLFAITAMSESRNRDTNPDGSVVTSPAGARGRMQVMDGTNRDPGFGVRPAQGDSLEERARVGRDYLMAMRDRYGGDMAKAWGAYNWGPGNLDAALKAHGDGWLAHAPTETQAYVAKNMRALGQPSQMASQDAPPPPPPPAIPSGQPDQPVAPYQVASIGPTPPPPSAPGSSPPADGAPPAAPPQAAAGGNPTTFQPTQQEVQFIRKLLTSGDPTQEALGEELANKLAYKMTQAEEWETTTVNGVPAQVNARTGQMRMLSVPDAAKTQTVQDVPGLTPGTVAQQKPTGEISVLQAPPAGFQGGPQQQSYIRGGPQDPGAGSNLVANEGKLRDDYDKQLKDYTAAREGYQKVVQAARTGTPAGDIALVFGYMKTLDPGSTVREGEAATIQNSGTIPQTIQNMYNKMLTGEGRLLPEQRAQFASSAEQQFKVYQRSADALNERYGELARSYGFEPSRVIRSFEPIEPYNPAAGAKTPVPEVAIKAWRGYATNQKAPVGSPDHPFLARDAATLQGLDKPENRGKWVVGPDGRKGQIQ